MTRPMNTLVCFAALAFAGGCGDDGAAATDTGDGGGGTTIPEEVSFARDVAPITSSACASCHTADASGGFADADTHAGWMDSSSTGLPYCSPGDLDGSYGYLKIVGAQGDAGGGGAQMPTTGALSSADEAMIEAWVLDGCLP